jgi:hypothetical protein
MHNGREYEGESTFEEPDDIACVVLERHANEACARIIMKLEHGTYRDKEDAAIGVYQFTENLQGYFPCNLFAKGQSGERIPGLLMQLAKERVETVECATARIAALGVITRMIPLMDMEWIEEVRQLPVLLQDMDGPLSTQFYIELDILQRALEQHGKVN